MTDWQNPFKPEDFKIDCAHAEWVNQLAADNANARFRELLEKCPKVYQTKGDPHWWNPKEPRLYHTHQAYLVDIRKL